MAESICRALRDGALEGEHAPALTIKDSVASPFGFDVFAHVLSQLSSFIFAGKSQSRGLVIVSFSRSPLFYLELLKNKGIDVASLDKRIQILDCYNDPCGWKEQLTESGNLTVLSYEASISSTANVFRDVKHLDKLYNSIIELGKGLAGGGKIRFSIAIDSVNEMLRHASMSSVACLLSTLRSHGQISSIFWLLHSDLHEARVTAVLEYLSSMVASLEPLHQPADGKRGDLEKFSLIEHNSKKGNFHVRFKRRNGRVHVMSEEVHIEQSGINFISLSSEGAINQGLVPKVMVNPYKFMMAEGLWWIANMIDQLMQRKICRQMRTLAVVRLFITVIQMMRCLILMRTQMMTWISDCVQSSWSFDLCTAMQIGKFFILFLELRMS